MSKIYKYRPLSEFLFKELYYQEIYFASNEELNDPLDLNARIEFSTKDREGIEYLVWFIIKTQFIQDITQLTKASYNKYLKFWDNENIRNSLINEIQSRVNAIIDCNKNIWTYDIIKIIKESIEKTETEIVFNSQMFQNELERITTKFLKSSYVSSFSKTNNDFLMWSHYASKHSGICLEFNLKNNIFPFETYHRNLQKNKFETQGRISEWDSKTTIRWSGNLREVKYDKEQPYVNFYKFAPVFENEDDCDLLNLSKTWTHQYARELAWVFTTKTEGWKYENEYRILDINFDHPKIPEQRIRHYPIEALSAIYFGLYTPPKIRNRIYQALTNKTPEIQFFKPILSGTSTIEFSTWENPGQ